MALSIEEQEAEATSRLETYGTVQTTEIEPANWVCEVAGRAGHYKVGGGGDGGLFLTRLSALKWCLRVLENTFDGGYFDDKKSPSPGM